MQIKQYALMVISLARPLCFWLINNRLPGLLIFMCVPVALPAEAQPTWYLSKDKNNIQVYTAIADSAGVKPIKVVGLFEGTPEKVIAIFLDVDKQKQWVYGTKRSYIIKKFSDKELLYYVETALPWPVSNRDIAIRMKINENKTGSLLTITTVGEPNAIAVTKGKVRVSRFTGNWEVKVVGKNKLAIDYYLFVDPGGSLPLWIVNMFIDKGPYETFSKLAELLKN